MTYHWYVKGNWTMKDEVQPLHAFLAMYIKRALVLKGTMGLCLGQQNLTKVIRNGIEEYEVYKVGKKWHTRFD